jgi:hypothetical protein
MTMAPALGPNKPARLRGALYLTRLATILLMLVTGIASEPSATGGTAAPYPQAPHPALEQDSYPLLRFH